MPAGWLADQGAVHLGAVYHWAAWAGVPRAGQLVASLGMLRLLRSHVRPTPARAGPARRLPRLRSSPLPAGIWFAAGINQLPIQIALVFGLHAHLAYLRTARLRSPWSPPSPGRSSGSSSTRRRCSCSASTRLVALCWFARGTLAERLARAVARLPRRGDRLRRRSAVAYLALYVKFGLDFCPAARRAALVAAVAYRLVGVAFSTGLIGGPLSWQLDVGRLARRPQRPDQPRLVGRARLASSTTPSPTRTASRRAWSLIVFTSRRNVVPARVGAGQRGRPGHRPEYRYQTESAALVRAVVGLAFLPLLGARESQRRARGGRPAPRATGAGPAGDAVVVVAARWSRASRYVDTWQDSNPSEAVLRERARDRRPPRRQAGPAGRPGRSRRRCCGPTATRRTPTATSCGTSRTRRRTPTSLVDDLYVLDDRGKLAPVGIPPARYHDGRSAAAATVLTGDTATIPLDGPVIGGGWWIRMDYGAPRPFRARIGLGRHEPARLRLPAGLHTVFFQADGSFDLGRDRDDSPAGTGHVRDPAGARATPSLRADAMTATLTRPRPSRRLGADSGAAIGPLPTPGSCPGGRR